MTQKKVLFVFTSADKLLDENATPTGWYLPEAAHPYYVLQEHVNIDFASPKGPNPPIDPESIKMFKSDDGSMAFLNDAIVTSKMASAMPLNQVKASDYDAVFYVGGHGPVIDLASDPTNASLASEFYRNGKIVAAVCHGPAALVGVTGNDGKSIFAGRQVTGFSDEEEEAVGMSASVPFLLESRISELGGKYEKSSKNFEAHVVKDGTLISGQNPLSAKGVGEAILKALA
ncbi:hypothetical protein M408DRAFT_78236 [Serendipita vermifera MAFF 305830]|uniref:D-lactate dehydratase n=1 Tax=Serendipita vermifera MAFF 305830 TaxID=933852 RepID=A0A0C3AE72_SERVB|nr:hypothetical protein M408DRAFT_78236 [Serendipita vermifera MAFF 305830]